MVFTPKADGLLVSKYFTRGVRVRAMDPPAPPLSPLVRLLLMALVVVVLCPACFASSWARASSWRAARSPGEGGRPASVDTRDSRPAGRQAGRWLDGRVWCWLAVVSIDHSTGCHFLTLRLGVTLAPAFTLGGEVLILGGTGETTAPPLTT